MEYIESKLEVIEELWSEFKAGHKELLKVADPDKLNIHIYVTDEIYDKAEEVYIDHKCELTKLLKGFIPERSGNETIFISNDDTSAKPSYVRLPKVNIPIFTGKYSEWITFRDLFLSMIHNNSSLDKVQKLHYLKGCLTGEAEQLVRHISVSETNYDICWKQLEDRYNNRKYLSHCILTRLLGQTNAVTETADFLKELLDTSTECLNSLVNIGVNISSWDILLIHILTLKLDPESRKQWELNISTNTCLNILPTFQQFKEFLTCRYRALEFTESSFSNRRIDGNLVQNPVRPRVLHTNVFEVACEYCSGNHKLCFCMDFISESYKNRHEFVVNNRICFNCLGSNHSVRFCQKPINCRVCQKRHHSLLHPPNLTSETSHQNDSVHNIGEVPISNNQVETPIDSVVSCLSTSTENQVLLTTALVRVKSGSGQYQVFRAIIDQGSQASFISETAFQRLGLKSSSAKTIISGLGGYYGSVASKGKILLEIQSMFDSTFSTNVTTHILKQITSYMSAKQIPKIDWINSANVTLADPQYNVPNKIDMLLGAEVYSQILQEGIIRGPRGSPVAQCTSLGWVLSGPVQCINSKNNIVVLHSNIEKDDNILQGYREVESNSTYNLGTPEDQEKCMRLTNNKKYIKSRHNVKSMFHTKIFYNTKKEFNRTNEYKRHNIKVMKDYLYLKDNVMIEQNVDRTKLQNRIALQNVVVQKDKSTVKHNIY
ncbi:uncharacterized protein LOC131845174 [Achroia grisella]|uniref:uncharacterized protein LOC131845174 n=1 Tax=Achroia grisella TaxID=688607 RepID=UPI0027D30E75|nr:uncharacterized protein LOC131845174 [Achroia grisella]